jgi:hypothetical protein
MALIVLEALGALLVLVFIVWWTMFSGRNKGEPPPGTQAPDTSVTKDTPGRAQDADHRP